MFSDCMARTEPIKYHHKSTISTHLQFCLMIIVIFCLLVFQTCLVGTLTRKKSETHHHIEMELILQQKLDTEEKVLDLLLMLEQKWDCILLTCEH